MKTNFKASKTVLALAVAGLISCGAFAADTETELKTDWTITADESGTLSKDTDVTNLTVEKEGSLTGTDKALAIRGSSSNAGTISTGSGDVTVFGTFTNAGTLTTTGAYLVEEGSTMTNTGVITAGTVTVKGQLNTGLFVYEKEQLKNHLKFSTLNLEEGGLLNITAMPELTKLQAMVDSQLGDEELTLTAGDMVFNDGTINFKGGQFAVAGASDPMNVYVLGTGSSDTTLNFTNGTYDFGTVGVYGNTVVDINQDDQQQLSVSVEKLSLNQNDKKTAKIQSGTVTVGELDVAGENSAIEISGGDVSVRAFRTTAGTSTITEASDNVKITTLEALGGSFSNAGTTVIETAQLGKAATTGTNATPAVKAEGVTNENTGNLTIGTLVFNTNDSVLSNSGSLTLDAIDTSALGADEALSAVTNTGTIYTDIANLITSKTDGQTTTWTATKFGAALAGDSGTVLDESYTGTYTKAEYDSLKTKVGNVVFDNAQFVARADDGTETKETFDNAIAVGDVGHSGVTIAYSTPTPAKTLTDKDAVMGSVELVPNPNADEIKSFWLNMAADASSGPTHLLTLRGDVDNEVIIGAKDADGKYVMVHANNVQFGKYESDVANVHNDLTLYGTSNAVVGTVVMDEEKAIALASGAKLNVTGELTTTGVASASEGMFTIDGGSVTLRGSHVDYSANAAAAMARASVPATPVTPLDYSLHISAGGASLSNDEDGNHSQLVLGDEYEAAADAYAAAHEGHNFIYVGEQTTFEGALPTFGEEDETNDVVIDMSTLSSSHYVADVLGSIIKSDEATGSLEKVDKFVINNLQGINNRVLSKDDATGKYSLNIGEVASNAQVDFGTVFYGESNDQGWWGYTTEKTADANGVVAVEANKEVIRDFYEMGSHLAGQIDSDVNAVSFGHNAIADAIVFGFDGFMSDVDEAWAKVAATEEYQTLLASDPDAANRVEDAFYNSRLESYIEAGNTATNMAVLGGAFSVGFDINDQIRNTIDRRSSLANLNVARNATGITPWVDVMGTWNTADGLYGSSGYEADIYGATLGADYTASCGAILGAAISIGQADANSVDASTKVDNDVDFWGVSFYGSHRIGNVNGKFDIGYVSTSNDLSSSSAYFGTVKESLDADIFTVGVGAEYLATVGSLNVVPHAGIRWSSLDMDDSKYGADYDKMNLFQMPIGVAFSGTFDMTGWKVAPMLDISVVPTFGDKDAVASYAGGIKDTVRVVDSNPVQMTLGVNATVDAWTLGVNYGLSAGSDERLNNAFNFHARYTF